MARKHIVIDARIRRASTGRPVDRLLQYLPELDRDNRFTVVLEHDDDWQPAADNFQVKHIGFRQYSFNPLQQLRYSRLLRSLKPDLVFFTMTGQAPLLYSGRQITFTHDLTMLRYARAGRLPEWLHRLRMIGYRLLFRSGNRRASHIIVPSQFVANDLAKHYPFTKAKTTVIYEASEPPIEAKPQMLPGIKKPFIFHVGSPFPHKNIERLIEAFSVLAADKRDLQLVLGGKLEFYFKQLSESLVRHPLRERIIIPGFVSSGQLKWLYENAEAYVLPSLSEGFGLPGLEAMVHGCPLVSSNATCLPEVYGSAAHYFDPINTDDMAAKIGEVLEDVKLRQSLIEQGHQRAAKYSWRRMAEQTLAVYGNVLSEK